MKVKTEKAVLITVPVLPSRSGLSSGYSGMHSRKSSQMAAALSGEYRARTCNGLRPLILIASASRCDSVSKARATERCPSRVATWSALSPSESVASKLAPFWIRADTTFACPAAEATCSAVWRCASRSSACGHANSTHEATSKWQMNKICF